MSNRVSLRQIRAFHAVINAGSLSEAAELLNLSLPSVSKQLTALEHELGIELFSRQRGKTLTPTRQGIEFYKSVETTITELNNFRNIAKEISEAEHRALRVAATAPLINSEPLMQALREFRAEHNEVRLTLDLHTRLDIEKWDNMRHIEFAIAMLPTSNPSLKSRVLLGTRAVAVVSKSHPLANKEVLDPEIVRGQPILLQSRRLLRARIDAVHQSHGYHLQPALESTSSFTCCRLAAAGLGIAICDPFSPNFADASSLVVRRWQPEVALEYGLLEPRDANPDPMVEGLKELILEKFSLCSESI